MNAAYLKVHFIPGDYNYTQQVLLDSYLNGMRFDQVAITFRPREYGSSFVSPCLPLQDHSANPDIDGLRQAAQGLPAAGQYLRGYCDARLPFRVTMVWLAGRAARPVEHVNLVLGLGLFGLNTGFFGLLAELVVQRRRRAS